jgi:prevent-host-death family protein
VDWVGIRELANRAGGVVDRVTKTGHPALITKRGRPVAALVPLDEDGLEDWVLGNAPEFTRQLKAADKDLAAGRTRPALEVFDELEAGIADTA